MAHRTTSAPATARSENGNVGDAIDLVRDYVRQETTGPLKGLGRWIGFGLAGAALISTGLVLVVLGVLRLVQTEVTALDGAWSWVPYTIAIAVAAVFTVLAASRVKKTSLGKER